ncbi:MAG: cytochrome c1 [Rhizobiales bacterium]|nr:cytochrome c1 [Hyphomicrobiales bacterium]
MKTITKLLAAAGLVLTLGTAPVMAAGGSVKLANDIDFSFEGIFGTFDRGQLQRGYLVYKEVCAACHSMRQLSFRNLGEPGGPEFSEDEVKALAATFEVPGEPDSDGEISDRPAIPADKFPSPFANEQAARASNSGALPPDLSLVTKSREGWHYPWYSSPFIKLVKGNGGPEYVASLLAGYQDPPSGEEQGNLSYNPYFPGNWIAMAPPLSEDQVEYADGTKATVDQMSRDVAAFMAWAAEPKMEQRKRIGFMVIIYLGVLALLMYLVKNKIWRDQH